MTTSKFKTSDTTMTSDSEEETKSTDEIRNHMGIFLSDKDVKSNSFETVISSSKIVISRIVAIVTIFTTILLITTIISMIEIEIITCKRSIITQFIFCTSCIERIIFISLTSSWIPVWYHGCMGK